MGSTLSLSDLAKYGINAQIQGNKIILTYPKWAIEQKVLEEIMGKAPPELRNKVTVRATGDVIVEVLLQ